MTDKVGRNDPCPCGSGKKYKNCCLNNSAQQETGRSHVPSFRFEPGSYGDTGTFMPSIACLKENKPGEWNVHFVLVRPATVHAEEDEASTAAENDLEAAFAQREQIGSDLAVAEYLRARGYASVEGFKIAGKGDIGFHS